MRTTVGEIKRRLAWRDNPYLVALRDGTLTRDEFLETQVQFWIAVGFFSRPMAVLAARLPRADLRLGLLENVHDEHGHGNPALAHEKTFLTLLERLGVSEAQADRHTLWPEVRTFNTALAGLCTLDDPLTGLGTLGIIEDLFSGISAAIGDGIVARGWLPRERLVHYTTHETLDVEHAEGFYRLLDGPWAESPEKAYQVAQGFELGGYLMMRLYEDLWRARDRRWRRTSTGPHSVAAGSL